MAEFVIYGFLASLMLSLCLGPLGCFLLWKKQSFFGDTLSHSAFLGVAVAALLPLGGALNIWISIFVICLVLSGLLTFGPRLTTLPPDSWLGLLSITLISLGYIVMRYMCQQGILRGASIEHFLFGDVLLLNHHDLLFLGMIMMATLLLLYYYWSDFMAVIIDPHNAQLQGISADKMNFILYLMLSLVVATTLPMIGALLVPGLLILPAVCAKQLANSPVGMIARACGFSIAMTSAGLGLSYIWDWPMGPASMMAGFCLFLISIVYKVMMKRG